MRLRNSLVIFPLLCGLFLFPCARPSRAYIPDVGPGMCVSENCEDTYTPPSYSSGASSYSSGSSSYSDGGGYSNSYDAMAMNTAMGLMGSFMSSVMGGMERAAAQQAEYQRQAAEQQRIEAELARQERERLLAIKKVEQEGLRAEYQEKMARSSAAIRAGIGRIENMLGMSLSSEPSPLKIETLDDGNSGGLDWDGRRAGQSGTEDKPLELMRDDFGDPSVVDLRDKTDLTVRPEVVSGQARYEAPQPASAPESAPAQESAAVPELSAGQEQTTGPVLADEAPGQPLPEPTDSGVQAPAPSPGDQNEVDPHASPAPQPEETLPVSDPALAAASEVPDHPAAETFQNPAKPGPEAAWVDQPETVESAEPRDLTDHPAAFRQTDLPDGSQGYVEASPETAGAEPYSSALPWRSVPVETDTVDPALLKGDTPPIRPETVETRKQERAMMENFNKKSAERAEELLAESQMQEVRKAAEKDLREKAAAWHKKKALEKEMAALEEADYKKYPGLREAIQESKQEWADAEKEYDALKAKEREKARTQPEEDLSLLLQLTEEPRRIWPGPGNPEPPLANPVENDADRFEGVLKIWRKRKEAKSGTEN